MRTWKGNKAEDPQGAVGKTIALLALLLPEQAD